MKHFSRFIITSCILIVFTTLCDSAKGNELQSFIIELRTHQPASKCIENTPNCKINVLDHRTKKNIVLRFDNGAGQSQKQIAEPPTVNTNPEIMTFCKTELPAFAGELGFLCRKDAPAAYTLDIVIQQFGVGFYSGKGWKGIVSFNLILKDKAGNELYETITVKGEAYSNVSASKFQAMTLVANEAWAKALERSIEEFQSVAAEMSSHNVESVAQQIPATQQQVNVIYVQTPVQQGFPQAQPAPQALPTPAETASKQISDVDENIPVTNTVSDNTFVLIIANENYKSLQNVSYASYDGQTFKDYCIKTLGVPKMNIFDVTDATYGEMEKYFAKLERVLNELEGSRGIVYYCGHGTNDEKTGAGFLVPVDGDGKTAAIGYDLNQLYQRFASTKATSVTYFMDACFSGTGRSGDMLVAARGTARAPKQQQLSGNTVVFSATSSDETAMAYEEKQHGLFTYYLLKKLQETQGNVTYEELNSYISKNVMRVAELVNDKPQHTTTATSASAIDTWKSMKLK